ncbi:GNAT family N-acetyltransferase [Thalassococcus sp. S3]|uniref:GNAT family N-acetyltransferase n=1 Tax=Thalassococcus sp. S3 TaxID=2017482 RepID=UPI00102422C2|nr:GNAT family N-acetyltransferase [Thalassococcus sp. S3]QBF29934.1 GNAT family N-acetyltransferase [Thalassococcus sp. S3]
MTVIPNLITDRLTLRAPSIDDFDSFAAFYASDRSKFVGGPATTEQAWRMLATEIGHWTLRGYGRWAVEETATGRFAGIIGPWNPHGWPEPEIGWDLMNGFEGRGYATEAALAARHYVYNTLNWPTAISLVAHGNDASAAVALRLGAIEDGIFTHERWGEMRIFRHPAPEALQ